MGNILEQVGASKETFLYEVVNILDTDPRNFSGSALPAIIHAKNLYDQGLEPSFESASTTDYLPESVVSIDLKNSTEALKFGADIIVEQLKVASQFLGCVTQLTQGEVYVNVDETGGDGFKVGFYGDKDQSRAASMALGTLLQSDPSIRAIIGFNNGEWASRFNTGGPNSLLGYTELATDDIDMAMSQKPDGVNIIGELDSSEIIELKGTVRNFVDKFNSIESNFSFGYRPDPDDVRSDLRRFVKSPLRGASSPVVPLPETTSIFIQYRNNNQPQIWEANKIALQSYSEFVGHSDIRTVYDREKRGLIFMLVPNNNRIIVNNFWERAMFKALNLINYNQNYDGELFPPGLGIDINIHVGTGNQIEHKELGVFDVTNTSLSEIAKVGGIVKLDEIMARTSPLRIGTLSLANKPNLTPPGWIVYEKTHTTSGRDKLTIVGYESNFHPIRLDTFIGNNIDAFVNPNELGVLRAFSTDMLSHINISDDDKGLKLKHDKSFDGLVRAAEHVRTFLTDPDADFEGLSKPIQSPSIRHEIKANYEGLDSSEGVIQLFSLSSKSKEPLDIRTIFQISHLLGFDNKEEVIDAIKILRDKQLIRVSAESGLLSTPLYVKDMLDDESDVLFTSNIISFSLWQNIIQELSFPVERRLSDDEFKKLDNNESIGLLTTAAINSGHPDMQKFLLAHLNSLFRRGKNYPYTTGEIRKIMSYGGVDNEIMFQVELHILNIDKDVFDVDLLKSNFESLVNAIENDFIPVNEDTTEMLMRIAERLDSVTPEAEKETHPLVFNVNIGTINEPKYKEVEKEVVHSRESWHLFWTIVEKSNKKALRTLISLVEPLDGYSEESLQDQTEYLLQKQTLQRHEKLRMLRVINKLSTSRDSNVRGRALDYLFQFGRNTDDSYLLARYLGNTVPTAFIDNRNPENHAALALLYSIENGDKRIIANNINNYLGVIMMDISQGKDIAITKRSASRAIDALTDPSNFLIKDVPDVTVVILWNLMFISDSVGVGEDRVLKLFKSILSLRNIIKEEFAAAIRSDIENYLNTNTNIKPEVEDRYNKLLSIL